MNSFEGKASAQEQQRGISAAIGRLKLLEQTVQAEGTEADFLEAIGDIQKAIEEIISHPNISEEARTDIVTRTERKYHEATHNHGPENV